jgi:hypothetical protein
MDGEQSATTWQRVARVRLPDLIKCEFFADQERAKADALRGRSVTNLRKCALGRKVDFQSEMLRKCKARELIGNVRLWQQIP